VCALLTKPLWRESLGSAGTTGATNQPTLTHSHTHCLWCLCSLSLSLSVRSVHHSTQLQTLLTNTYIFRVLSTESHIIFTFRVGFSTAYALTQNCDLRVNQKLIFLWLSVRESGFIARTTLLIVNIFLFDIYIYIFSEVLLAVYPNTQRIIIVNKSENISDKRVMNRFVCVLCVCGNRL
jgi:hypothetical protein